jgi:hypothetical protein
MTINLTIFRDEAPIEVSVEITRYYKGTAAIDDPCEVIADEVGTDEDGKEYQLSESEMGEAESAFVAKINEPDCRKIEPLEEKV